MKKKKGLSAYWHLVIALAALAVALLCFIAVRGAVNRIILGKPWREISTTYPSLVFQ